MKDEQPRTQSTATRCAGFCKSQEISHVLCEIWGVTNTEGAQVQALSPLPFWGSKCLRGPSHGTSQYGEMGWRCKCRKILVPRLKGLGDLVTPRVFCTKNVQFFLGISPQEGSICVSLAFVLLVAERAAMIAQSEP